MRPFIVFHEKVHDIMILPILCDIKCSHSICALDGSICSMGQEHLDAFCGTRQGACVKCSFTIITNSIDCAPTIQQQLHGGSMTITFTCHHERGSVVERRLCFNIGPMIQQKLCNITMTFRTSPRKSYPTIFILPIHIDSVIIQELPNIIDSAFTSCNY